MKQLLLLLYLLIIGSKLLAQNSLHLNIPIFDSPQNLSSPQKFPSMYQSLAWSGNFYEAAFFGLSISSDKLFHDKNWKNTVYNYASGILFSYYGSELPIPLGIWAHEEYHRAVLGVNDISSKNGNWIFHRWDGTVYGPSDEELTQLKEQNIDGLLYSYVAGVQYETQLTKYTLLSDFFDESTIHKSPLYLYNAFYVWNYFRFSTSTQSDSVKVIAPEFESIKPWERDFAGADLTAWAYDMFSPDSPYTDRSDFPNGDGENRRVGFHDLSDDAQTYLIKQRKLSLLNFINPAICLIHSIRLNESLEFLPFVQYQPTHFGNAISLVLPFYLKNDGYLISLTQYQNYQQSYYGADFGVIRRSYSSLQNLTYSGTLKIWKQPDDFFENERTLGGAVHLEFLYKVSAPLSLSLNLTAKTKGWLEGSPYLQMNFSPVIGVKYQFSTGEPN